MRRTLVRAVARLVLLPGLVIAVATLVKGYSEVGDGFTAGAIAALTILVQLVAFGPAEAARRLPVVRLAPAAAVAGLALALAVALVPVARGESLLEHAPAPGEDVVRLGTLELITAVAFDVGVFLVVVGTIVGAVSLIARTEERDGREEDGEEPA